MCEESSREKHVIFLKNDSKLENNLLKACQSHSFFLYLHPLNISILKIKADIRAKYHYNDR